jgi:predicted RNA-binding Zn-ribbon protein involved in translation (DUF1610 family)
MSNSNPYQAPTTASEPVVATASPHTCPNCGGQQSSKVSFNWWGGALGPKLFNVVRCDGCRTQYNGKTGGRLTKTIIVYQLVAFAIGVAIWLWFVRSQ